MKYRIICCLLSVLLFQSCSNETREIGPRAFKSVEIEALIQDSLLSIRALEMDDDYIYYGSSDHLGRFALKNENKIDITNFKFTSGKNHFKNVFTYDGEPLHFRSIAVVNGVLFGLSIENPARLYKIPRKGNSSTLVYEESNEKVFYDSMSFWNEMEGIAIGDPTESCMSIIITRDGGNTWTKVSCDLLPEAIEGEGAFAASDTNIAIIKDEVWIATGGVASRILYSGDKGLTWKVYDTPIIQGESTQGLYSIDFYDAQNGIGIGGDYTKPDEANNNLIITNDGGQTWSVLNGSLGYRSCVQYAPYSDSQGIVAVGFKGVDYSMDAGKSWRHLSDEGFYTLRWLNDSIAFAGGNGRLSKLTFRE